MLHGACPGGGRKGKLQPRRNLRPSYKRGAHDVPGLDYCELRVAAGTTGSTTLEGCVASL
jgi:hypothetical protein